MRRISSGLLALILTALLALRGGVCATAEKPTVRVACVGDSITYIGGFLRELKSMMQSDNRWNAEILNFGSDGATAMYSGRYYNGNSCGYANPAYQHYANYPASLNAAPDVVFIMLGTNDSRDCNWSEQGAEGFLSGYTDLICAYRSIGKEPKIFLVKPPSMYDVNMGLPGYCEQSLRDNILPLTERLAEENQLSLLDAYQATQNMPSSFRDGIHPAEDSEACRAIAALYFNALTSYLQVSAPVEKEPSSAGESVWRESEASVPNSALSSRPASEKTVSKPSVPGEPSSGEQLNRSSKLTEMPSQTAASSPAESSRVLSVVSGCSYENAPAEIFSEEETGVLSSVQETPPPEQQPGPQWPLPAALGGIALGVIAAFLTVFLRRKAQS